MGDKQQPRDLVLTSLTYLYERRRKTQHLDHRNLIRYPTDLVSSLPKTMALSSEQQLELQTQLQQVVVACNERCLYFAAKW